MGRRDDVRGFRPDRMGLGLGLIVAGVLLTLRQLGVVPLFGMREFWPLLLLGLGIGQTFMPGRRVCGLFVAGTGALFLAQSLGYAHVHRTWPLFLVLAGLTLVWQALAPAPGTGGPRRP